MIFHTYLPGPPYSQTIIDATARDAHFPAQAAVDAAAEAYHAIKAPDMKFEELPVVVVTSDVTSGVWCYTVTVEMLPEFHARLEAGE